MHLITAQDAAKIHNISKSAAFQLIQQRKLPCMRFSRNVSVRPEDLDDFISQNLI